MNAFMKLMFSLFDKNKFYISGHIFLERNYLTEQAVVSLAFGKGKYYAFIGLFCSNTLA